MIAVDTNLLIYAHRSSCDEHLAAKRAIESAAESPHGWGIPLPCITEFWSVVTHRSLPRPSSSKEAGDFVNELIEGGGAVPLMPQNGFWTRLSDAAKELNIAGARIFDLQIAVIARDSGASALWTHDRKFIKIAGINVLDPLQH